MINLLSSQWLFSIIVMFISYLVSVMIAGVTQSKVAEKFGDSTPSKLGYSSFNPLVYFDLLATLFLFYFKAGVPVFVPFNTNNIDEPYKSLKTLILYLTDGTVNLIIALICLTCSSLMYGLGNSLFFAGQMSCQSIFNLDLAATHLLSNFSSVNITIMSFLLTAFSLNMFMASFSYIRNIFRYFLTTFFNEKYNSGEYSVIYTILLFIILFFFSNILRRCLFEVIIRSVLYIVSLIGIY